MNFKAFGVILLFNLLVLPSFSNAQMNIVGFGDSLMAGYLLDGRDAFPTQLQSELRAQGIDVSISNAGVSGDTTSGGLARLNWSVPEGTQGVILALGANDALRGISPELSKSNLEKMIQTFQSRGIRVLLIGMLAPPNMGEAYAEKFNPMYVNLARQYGLSYYPFFLDGVTGEDGMVQADGMHPTSKGVSVMVKKMMPYVKKFINENVQ